MRAFRCGWKPSAAHHRIRLPDRFLSPDLLNEFLGTRPNREFRNFRVTGITFGLDGGRDRRAIFRGGGVGRLITSPQRRTMPVQGMAIESMQTNKVNSRASPNKEGDLNFDVARANLARGESLRNRLFCRNFGSLAVFQEWSLSASCINFCGWSSNSVFTQFVARPCRLGNPQLLQVNQLSGIVLFDVWNDAWTGMQ